MSYDKIITEINSLMYECAEEMREICVQEAIDPDTSLTYQNERRYLELESRYIAFTMCRKIVEKYAKKRNKDDTR